MSLDQLCKVVFECDLLLSKYYITQLQSHLELNAKSKLIPGVSLFLVALIVHEQVMDTVTEPRSKWQSALSLLQLHPTRPQSFGTTHEFEQLSHVFSSYRALDQDETTRIPIQLL